jgi:Lon protease-like protein
VGELIPLFPLSAPLFPGIGLPLVIFEPRYRRLLEDLLARPEEQRFFGVVAIRQGWEVEDVAPVEALYEVGCTARLQDVRLLPDGRFRVATVGERRFRVLDVVVGEEPPYLQADVDWLVEQEDADGAGQVRELFTEYVATVAALQGATAPDAGAETEHLLRDAGDDPRALSWLVASAALLSTDDRQALLTEPATRSRLAAESRLLRRELTLLRALQAVPAPLQQFAVPMAVN